MWTPSTASLEEKRRLAAAWDLLNVSGMKRALLVPVFLAGCFPHQPGLRWQDASDVTSISVHESGAVTASTPSNP